jgi:hypothetical protein
VRQQLAELKAELLASFHRELDAASTRIAGSQLTREEKARAVNALTGAWRNNLSQKVAALPIADRPNYALVLQYCFSVASLEYRHRVWPYEYMAFSRRVGELWEAFCSAAWDYPSRPAVARISVPSFATVRELLFGQIRTNIGIHGKRDEILQDIETLFEIVGDINMNEDEVFCVGDIPHVIDFKSGFGSNEKGNMLRLQTVGRAYRIWNHQTRLLLLVRQEENNNYLRVLRRAGLWEVHTGNQAYEQVSNLTGANIKIVRDVVVNWPSDLSGDLYAFLAGNNLTGYLSW